MKVLFCGDIVGRSGREAILKYVPLLQKTFSLDFVIVNGENAAHGFGITPAIVQELKSIGVDAITTGNHAWDQKDIIPYIEKEKTLLRPLNFPLGTPGAGHVLIKKDHMSLLVVNVMGGLFMESLDDPFSSLDHLLKSYKLTQNVTAILVDFHAEATSEKMAAAHYLDGRVSAFLGTHTHIPTMDARVFANGLGYQTDVGMTGDYDSVIGMKVETSVERFVKKFSKERLSVSLGDATLCGALLHIDNATGKTTEIRSIRLGGVLAQKEPIIFANDIFSI